MQHRLNKTALITGASSGIGEAYARLLSSLGYDLVIIARRKERLAALASQLETASGVTVTAADIDLCTDNGITVAENIIRSIDNLSVLVNNAGFGTLGDFTDVDISKTLDMITLHVTTPTRLIKASLPGMLVRREGCIINVASISPFLPLPGNVIYNGTKSYLIALSECLQLEVKNEGIRVQALCPGFTRTGFHSVDEYKDIDFSTIPGFMWMSPEKVVKQSWSALGKRKVIFIPGLINRLVSTLFNGLFRYIAGKRTEAPPARKINSPDQ